MMKVVEILIKHGADVNAQTHSLETPLHLAARRAHFDVVKMLLKHGAQPRKLTKKGHSPLHYSVSATSTYQEKGLSCRVSFFFVYFIALFIVELTMWVLAEKAFHSFI